MKDVESVMPNLTLKRFRALGVSTLLGGALMVMGGFVAPASATDANAKSDATKIKELQKRLDQRDALIRNLMRRVEKLEREEAGRRPAAQRAAAAGPAEQPAAPPTSPGARPPATAPRAAATPAPATAPQTPQQRPAPQQAAAEGGGPGQFTVSPEAAERALERALVQTGALLLEPWQAEFVPSITYQRNDISFPDQIVLTTAPSVFIAERRVRTTQVEAAGLLRLGLPWQSQAEFRLPYDYKSVSNTERVSGTGFLQQITDASGLGDLSLGLTHQLLKEGEWRPNLFFSGSWDSNTGQVQKNLALGTNFDEFKVGLTATKRQDPLVFTSSLSYQTSLENKGIQPGDQYTGALGMLFAVSPETSLQFSQQVTFIKPLFINHQKIPGSDQYQGIFNAGVLSILGPGLVVNFVAAIGETPDAPNLTLQLSMPIRLN